MKRTPLARLRMAAVVAALAISTAGCTNKNSRPETDNSSPPASKAPTGPETGKALKTVKAGTLTACTKVPHVPFEVEENGQFDGIDIELVRALAGRLALEVAFVKVDDIAGGLTAGTCDLGAASLKITADQTKQFDFSDTYFKISQTLLVRKADETKYVDIAALAGKTIGVQADTAGATYAKANANGATVKEFATADELYGAVAAGGVDAVLHDLPVNANRALTTGKLAVVKTFTDGGQEEYGLAMKKGQTNLKAALDGALTAVKADDTYPTILRRFLGDTAGQI